MCPLVVPDLFGISSFLVTQCNTFRIKRGTGDVAAALERGRLQTDAEFLVPLHAGFLPSPSFLERGVAYFFDAFGSERSDVAFVQAYIAPSSPTDSVVGTFL